MSGTSTRGIVAVPRVRVRPSAILAGCVVLIGAGCGPTGASTGGMAGQGGVGGASAGVGAGGSGGAAGNAAGASGDTSHCGVAGAGGSAGSAGNGAAGTGIAGTGAGGGGAGAGNEGGGGSGGMAGGAAGGGGSSGFSGSGGGGGMGGTSGNGGAGGTGAQTGGPEVDRSVQRLYEVEFSPDDADPNATRALGRQFAYLDTRVEPKGKLVIYLHGAGDFTSCGNGALGTLVASFGYHWFGPCYLSNYGVDNCGDDIEGCRREALEGADHHPFVDIDRPDSIEERIVRGLQHLAMLNPEGDWSYFVDGDEPRWSSIIATGHSHGASTSGVIGVHHEVFRVVMLAGPYDQGQSWLSSTPLTPVDRFFGLSHTGDSQHSGHLAAWASLDLPGSPTRGDGAEAPYGNSHRLYTSVSTGDAHGSVTAGNIDGLVPVWRYLYGAD